MNKHIIIAIDGVVGVGKGTLARLLAEKLRYVHIDSGAMYRAVTLHFLENSIDVNDTDAMVGELPNIDISFQVDPVTGANETWLNGENVEQKIRTQIISSRVPLVAQVPEIRKFLYTKQIEFGKDKGMVMEGRDIGTHIFPDAELKIFLTADADVRAQRRHQELLERGDDISLGQVLDSIKQRDKADMERAMSPLVKAEDAIEIDSTNMTIPQVVDRAYELAMGIINK
ncbi:MAG: (d)CMP kinase [Candidatus Nomurabacteria bacterium]|nr:(d)CMP kinase [Candidatus Nomurabacteria bacterium]